MEGEETRLNTTNEGNHEVAKESRRATECTEDTETARGTGE